MYKIIIYLIILGTEAAAPATPTAAPEPLDAAPAEWLELVYELHYAFELDCKPGGGADAPAGVTAWKVNGTEVSQVAALAGRYELKEGDAVYSVARSTEDDWGNYTCLVAGVAQRGFRVKAKPVLKTADSTNVVEGQKLKLTCRVRGRPYPAVTWTYAAAAGENETDALQAVGERGSVQASAAGVPGGELLVEATRRSDAGVYSCRAPGSAPSSTTLRVFVPFLVSPHLAQEVVDGSANREKRCIFPTQPEHGTFVSNVPNGKPGDQYDYLVVNVTCDQNSSLEGLESVFCYNGWWAEPLPKCVLLPLPISQSIPVDNGSPNSGKVSCSLPPYPLHGTYVSNIPNGSPGSLHSYLNVNVTCNRGYRIEGKTSNFCYSGWWTENMPKCIPSPLPVPLLTPEAEPDDKTTNRQQVGNKCILPQYSAHATYTTNIAGAKPGDAYDIVAITITCEKGYVVNGPSLVFCTGGQWPIQIPQCVPRCRLAPHPSVAYRCLISIELSDSGGRFRDCDEYEPLGTLARPVCQPHYHSTTALTFMECKDGEWTNNFQRCTPECGTLTPKGSQLILNGTIAKLGEVPWHAAIYRKTTKPYTLICGGSLISSNVIISAAHCFWDSLVGKLPASDYIVALGKLYRDFDSKLDKPQWSNVESLRLPQRFRESATNFQDDIAVLELSTEIVFQAHIRPVCVDFDVSFERRQLQPGKKGKVAGWGLTTELGNPSEELRTVELPFVSIETCFEKVPHTFSPFITSDKICAGYNDAGTALCKGDSGGGLTFLAVDRSTPRYYLRGVASTAPTNDNACNANTYTTFTRILKHENFVTLYWRQ